MAWFGIAYVERYTVGVLRRQDRSLDCRTDQPWLHNVRLLVTRYDNKSEDDRAFLYTACMLV